MMALTKIYEPIQSELKAAEQLFIKELKSANGLLGELTRYVIRMPGKRIRPALALLGAGVVNPKRGPNFSKPVQLATAVEMIHTATLLHDDVIDGADLRRGLSTLNAKWGDTLSVLSGDFLYSKAFCLLSDLKNETVSGLMSSMARKVCEGEVAQIQHQKDLNLSRQRYLQIIQWKTASLMEGACKSGALLAGATGAQAERLGTFGLNFGLAFQIMDDAQDILGEEEASGKSLGTDLYSGQLTLPLLYLRDAGGYETREHLTHCFNGNGTSIEEKKGSLRLLQKEAARIQVGDYCRGTAARYLTKARQAINIFPDSAHKKSLLALTDFLIQ